jgi:hypothetical protein
MSPRSKVARSFCLTSGVVLLLAGGVAVALAAPEQPAAHAGDGKVLAEQPPVYAEQPPTSADPGPSTRTGAAARAERPTMRRWDDESWEKHWEHFGERMGEHWGRFGERIGEHWGAQGEAIGEHWGAFGEGIGEHFGRMGEEIGHHFGELGQRMGRDWGRYGQRMGRRWGDFGARTGREWGRCDDLDTHLDRLGDELPEVVGLTVDSVMDALDTLLDSLDH